MNSMRGSLSFLPADDFDDAIDETADFVATPAHSTPVVGGPVISGTVGGQQIVDKQTDALFSKVMITDANAAAQNLTVTVRLSDPSNGAFGNLGAGAYDSIIGEYLVTGTPAQVTAALDGLIFTPTVPHGVTRTTTFALAVDGPSRRSSTITRRR